MSEMSQAERTALGATMRASNIDLDATDELSGIERELSKEIWLAARDYGRERERALAEALEWALARIEAISGPVTEPWPSFDDARKLAAGDAQPKGHNEIRLALAELIRLKDGPRDDAYHAAKDAAWDRARTVLASPGEPEGQFARIEWWDEPERNARYYRHIGCDEGDRHWIVPLDDCPAPTREDRECARCALIVPLVARDVQPDHGPGEPSEARTKFDALADEWVLGTLVVSSIHQQMKHPAIQQIIAMGAASLPFIKRRMETHEEMWFASSSLRSTGIDAAQGETTIKGAEKKWLVWLDENAIRAAESNG